LVVVVVGLGVGLGLAWGWCSYLWCSWRQPGFRGFCQKNVANSVSTLVVAPC
jgi:hypothetical protein